MTALFNVTYDIVTPESAEHGEVAERGFICEGATLRDAMAALFETRTSQCEGETCREANDSQETRANWFTVYNGPEFASGACESRSIHFPGNATGASRARLVRLLKGY